MRRFIRKIHLPLGLAVSLVLPGIFVFARSWGSLWVTLNVFVASFLAILGPWIMTFALVDFNGYAARRSPAVRYARVGLSFAAAILWYVGIGLTLDQHGNLLSQVAGDQVYSFKAWFFLGLRIALFNLVLVLLKYFFDAHQEKQQLLMEHEMLKREHLHSVHEALKQQVNPHFLFNSLNTLQALVKRDRDQALRFIGELSSVYRYMLHHYDQTEVSLEEELRFLASYLYLLQIRFGSALCTEIRIPAGLQSRRMPPNTLQLLIENAVKHNLFTPRRPLHIAVYAEGEYLVVRNNLQAKNEPVSSFHFGLNNISSRYRILYGKDIVVQQESAYFQVLLPLTEPS